MPPLPRWTVTHSTGICLTTRFALRPLPTAKVVRTRCNQFVLFPISIGSGYPTCEQCIAAEEDPDRYENLDFQTAKL